jgi:hypothetical protein
MPFVGRSLAIAVALTTLGACASAPEQCDLQQPVGACDVRIELKRGNVMACYGEQPVQAAPVCMKARIDVTNNRGYTSRNVTLAPGQCLTLGSAVASAAQASCSAFAIRTESAAR